jgi:hypothetical protein
VVNVSIGIEIQKKKSLEDIYERGNLGDLVVNGRILKFI